MATLLSNFLTATALLTLYTLPITRGGVLAVSKLQSCVNDGSTPGTSLSCSKKIVVAVTLQNNKLYETEFLNFTVSCVNSPTDTCPCPCNYATDPTCTCRDLQQSIVVAATKSAVSATYPLTYGRQFNGRPFEDIILRPSCSDQPSATKPTCGWAQQPDPATGQLVDIPDSQGFCCSCTFMEILFGAGQNGVRGGLQCAQPSMRSSASCLRFDDNWWWSGFTIGSYLIDFSVSLNITTYTSSSSSSGSGSGGGSGGAPPPPAKSGAGPPSPAPSGSSGSADAVASRSEVLRVTPAQPFVMDSQQLLSAQLLGDLSGYAQIPNLAGQWLMVPTPVGMGPNEAVQYNRDEWMILDPSLVTLSGECDKIGVSYSAFRNQANGCAQPAGTCLKNQIYDYYFADVDRMTRGLDPLYFVGRYGGGSANTNQMLQQVVPGGRLLSLSLPVPSIQTSLLTLSVSADSVALVTNASPARILSAQVCAYAASGICGGFQALATSGYLLADVQNAGYIAADYTLSVVNCTIGVLPVPAQYASIAAQAIRRFTFQLQMQTDQAIANASCTVAATDATGAVSATDSVRFYTNATKYDPVPNQSNLNGQVTGPGAPTPSVCASQCPQILNIKCSLANRCYGRLAQGLGAMSGGLAALTLLGFAIKQGWVTTLLRIMGMALGMMCSCCRGGRSVESKAHARDDGSQASGPQGRKRSGPGSSYLGQAGAAARRSWNAATDRALEVLNALRLHQLAALAATAGMPAAAPPPPPACASLHTDAGPLGQQLELTTGVPGAQQQQQQRQQQQAYQPVPASEEPGYWQIAAAKAQRLVPPPASPAGYAPPGQGSSSPLPQPAPWLQQQGRAAKGDRPGGGGLEEPASPMHLSPEQAALLPALSEQQNRQQAAQPLQAWKDPAGAQ